MFGGSESPTVPPLMPPCPHRDLGHLLPGCHHPPTLPSAPPAWTQAWRGPSCKAYAVLPDTRWGLGVCESELTFQVSSCLREGDLKPKLQSTTAGGEGGPRGKEIAFFLLSGQRVPLFHFALGPANHVPGPGSVNCPRLHNQCRPMRASSSAFHCIRLGRSQCLIKEFSRLPQGAVSLGAFQSQMLLGEVMKC